MSEFNATMTLILQRTDKGEDETIRFTKDVTDCDIHDMFKKFSDFLLAMTFSPESIQNGADEFDIERI